MIRISIIQLFILILIFEIGSTTLFAIGIGVGQDAWMVVLLIGMIGFFLILIYTQIAKMYPDQNFSEVLHNVIGKKLTPPLLLLYCVYFYSQATFNFYEFGALIKLTTLPQTPLPALLYLFVFVMMYILSKGFEVLARTAEILTPYVIIFLISIYIFTLLSGEFDFTALQPVLGNGFQPVLEEAVKHIGFPFGELILFLMFWHYIENKQKIRKMALLAVGFSIVMLLLSLIAMISVLGPDLTAKVEIPLLETILAINIADIIINLDSLAVFIMFIGGFYKTALHFWGFVLMVTWLVKRAKTKWIVSIFGLLLPIVSLIRFPTLADQRWIGLGNQYVISLFAFLPVLLLMIIFLKERTQK
ncbi:spore germination protein [Alkalihalobacillus sp. MEB130]|uniref:GerAB/ArcD/ProY family transporter n=1 Tax=Alkalihalobacillus sp. MEB130 TaxID=2976704 RepID=UPI0028DF03A7|nr:GerAB/ArcD/ProY family transporter [Alkalihalobacillus sp. MEB130]MDT8860775.1 spore germination protein [Alkalihalobacillus sp. MEB130]